MVTEEKVRRGEFYQQQQQKKQKEEEKSQYVFQSLVEKVLKMSPGSSFYGEC